MRKLTILNQQYPPEVAATGQIFRVMAEYMAQNGFDVTVVTGTPYYPGMTEKPPKKEEMGGVHVRRIANTTFDKKSFLGKLFNLITFQISLFFYCIFKISKDQTVLVATAPPMAVASAAVGRFFRRYTVVMTVQDLYPDVLWASGMSSQDKLSYRFLKAVMRKSMRACQSVIAISTDMQRHLQASYGLAGVQLIPNLFIDDIRVVPAAPLKAEKGWQDNMVVQYSGNFGVAHEYETLLGAIRLLKDDPSILFQITGAGRHYDLIRAACEKEALPNAVFGGYAPADQLESHLGTADIGTVIFSERFQNVLMPSKYYGILASGRAVLLISSAQTDITRDMQARHTGIAVRHGESQALAQALKGLAADEAARRAMGANARALYDEQYAREAILARYHQALMEARP